MKAILVGLIALSIGIALLLIFRSCGSEEQVAEPAVEQIVEIHKEAQQRTLVSQFRNLTSLVEEAASNGLIDIGQATAAVGPAATVALQQQRDIAAIGVPTPITDAIVEGALQIWKDLKNSTLTEEQLFPKSDSVTTSETPVPTEKVSAGQKEFPPATVEELQKMVELLEDLDPDNPDTHALREALSLMKRLEGSETTEPPIVEEEVK